MRPYLYWSSLTLGVLLANHAARADSFSFITEPNPGDVTGTAGSTVGWGYSITNNSTSNYLNLTGIDSDLFLATDGTPDASIFDLPLLAPLETITEMYDPVSFIGLFQFKWNTDVPVGTTETGDFRVFAQFCDSRSLTNCGVTVSASAGYLATVISDSGPTVPEPPSLLELASGLCGIGLWLRKLTCSIASSRSFS